MQPGSEMDELVAERVLGWRREGAGWLLPDSDTRAELRPFSEDLSAAWGVATRICKEGFRLQLDGAKIWQARFYKSVAHTLETRALSATARNPATAICLAALAVRGVHASS